MKKLNRSQIMSRAWEIFKEEPYLGFPDSLFLAWKEYREKLKNQFFNRILNNLKTISILRTKEHYRLLNSKKGKEIMRREDHDESKEMLSKGLLCISDIIRQRRMDSRREHVTAKQRTKFRNRIINKETCIKINIEEYVIANY